MTSFRAVRVNYNNEREAKSLGSVNPVIIVIVEDTLPQTIGLSITGHVDCIKLLIRKTFDTSEPVFTKHS